jgi:hypothetical protein
LITVSVDYEFSVGENYRACDTLLSKVTACELYYTTLSLKNPSVLFKDYACSYFSCPFIIILSVRSELRIKFSVFSLNTLDLTVCLTVGSETIGLIIWSSENYFYTSES